MTRDHVTPYPFILIVLHLAEVLGQLTYILSTNKEGVGVS